MLGSGERVFGLADLDCFFVECERLHRPELRGRPVAIGGRPDGRGVVAACSYEARELGIRSAMPMAEAYRLAKGHPVVFLHSGLFGRYSLYSQRVQQLIRPAVPAFRPKSIDEFEFDLSGCGRYLEFKAHGLMPYVMDLRTSVRDQVGLPLSIGLGPSRIIAKMASRFAKPASVFRVTPDEARDFLAPQPVRAVPGIGPATTRLLEARGIATVGDLLALPGSFVRHSFDLNLERIIGALTRFEDPDSLPEEVDSSPRAAKSIGHETTFPRDTNDIEFLERSLWHLTEESCYRLRQGGYAARQVTVRVRYSDFKTVSRTAPLETPTDSDYTAFATALRLLGEVYQRRVNVRLIGVRLEKLTAGASQTKLFARPEEVKDERLFAAVDKIRARFGKDSIVVGRSIWTPPKEERADGSPMTSFLQAGQ
jgi:DNA polymerase IV